METENNVGINVPVALIFFNRPSVLSETFEAIKKSKPSELFLIQDGPRVGNSDDINKIKLCRDIVENIDWECDIHKYYSDKNLGCGMRVYSGISKAFEVVDRLCIIEDDCVPSSDFFRFCFEMLEYYKNDTRIHKICGMNNLEVFDETPYSYVFATTGSLWGWATWKRAWETIDYDLNFLEDEYAINCFLKSFPYPKIARNMVKKGFKMRKLLNKGRELSFWSYQGGMNVLLNSRINIIPKVNLTTNVGLHADATNGTDDIRKVPRGIRSVFHMKTHEMVFPLKHPKYVIRDVNFEKKLFRLMGVGHPLICLYRRIETITYRVFLGDFKGLYKALKKRLEIK